MRSFAQSTLMAWLAATVAAMPASVQFGTPSVHEQIQLPQGWASAGVPHADAKMVMQIALKQKDIAGLQKRLAEIADHKHADYGKWLTREQMEAYTAPSDETVNMVKKWITTAGIHPSAISQPSPDWLHVDVPVSTAEKLLSTNYNVYHHAEDDLSLVRTAQYSLPQQLRDHIDTIQPTTSFQAKKQDLALTKPAPDGPTDCHSLVTPPCVRSFYNVDYNGKGDKTSYGSTGLEEESARTSDYSTFLKTYDPNTSNTFNAISVAGGVNGASAYGEASLDAQWSTSLGAGNSGFYAVGSPGTSGSDYVFADTLVAFGEYLSGNDSAPNVVSTSYGTTEETVTQEYVTRICNEFMKAGSLGITILFSTGDYGVGRTCKSGFENHFPASCPYVTSVGATEFTDATTETASKDFASGGGFSTYFDTPDYQKTDVQNYIQNYVPSAYDGKYNKGGRAYPDVALVGVNIPIFVNGQKRITGGTSASTPMWSGLISQINDYRATLGKPVVGFLNPRLYTDDSIRSSLNDITVGSNPGCRTPGFSCEAGWDPVTGLGTMDFAKLRAAFAN
ncbi:hypothetical protein VHEMI07567 [[Torrubiella] hemipterigena]|uniref:tripeptidyl-peptidase II n=1 Tax=[Torrubiella] hemipterigena TaxID=1531966 RepID=A0A0A1T3X2_9HYPO|nr:hypothetical protein VHEMI07567 [[Torrubiella] hemipterigena]